MGIHHEKTPPYTPELNGKAERLNRTLNNMVRTMLLQTNMPDTFWAEAMFTAVYLLNRLPSSAINDEISYEHWYNKPLSDTELKLLKPFGCIVWDNIPKQRHGKRGNYRPLGTKGCFVGYVSSSIYKY